MKAVAWWIGISLLSALLAATASAESYYVAVDGKAENDGSREKPWPSIESALSKAGGGHTIIVRPGVYMGPVQIARAYAGTQEHPTVIRSEIKWNAVIVGAPYHGISNDDDCHWVVVDGFEVIGARYDGIKMNGDHNTVRNCWVHHNGHMGVAMHNKKGGVIENNLIEFNGGHVQFHHGVYADGDGLRIQGNIVRHNSSFGLHLYSAIKNSVIANNLVHDHPRKPGIIVSCPDGGGKNIIVNNTVAGNGAGITIWNGDGEVVVNNIVVASGEALQLNDSTRNVLADYNLCLPASERQGPHGITGDPMFADASRGVFWLGKGSPAIGKGTSEHTPATDFWGRPRPKDQAPDLGAFPFVPVLATEQARAGWYYNWAYRYSMEEEKGMPDLWVLPVSGK